MESVALDQEDIGQGNDRISHKKDIERILSAAAMNDLPKHIEIKGELYYGGDVAEQVIVDLCPGQIILHPCKDAAEQKEEWEIPEPTLVSAKEKDR
jgi:hypothetical protein